MDPNVVVPIRTLGSFPSGWTIQARVTHKTSLQPQYTFSLDLRDESAEIHAIVTYSRCPEWVRFYEGMQLNKVYYISGGDLIPANRKHTSVDNEKALLFTNQTTVSPCYEATPRIPTLPSFRFVLVDDLRDTDTDTAIDIIGIGEFNKELDESVVPSNIGQVAWRKIWIRDRTGRVLLSIYGDQVERFDGRHDEVVAVKGARRLDHNGLSLEMCRSGHILVNPDLPEAHSLRKWWLGQEQLVDP